MFSIIYITCRPQCKLEWTIQSLQKQIPPNSDLQKQIQLVIVDKLLDDYKHQPTLLSERIHYIQSVTHGWDVTHVPPKPTPVQGSFKITPFEYFAASNARNTGVCYAKHSYIAFVDDTSYLTPTWLQSVLEGIKNPIKKHVIGGAYKRVDHIKVENGEMIEGEILHHNSDSRLQGLTPKQKSMGIIPWNGSSLFGCSFCMPLQGYLDINGMNEKCDSTGSEDYEFGMRIEKYGYKVFYDIRMMTYEENQPLLSAKPVIGMDPLVSRDHYIKKLSEFGIKYNHDLIPKKTILSSFIMDLVLHTNTIQANPEFSLQELRQDILSTRQNNGTQQSEYKINTFVWWKPDMIHFFTDEPLSIYGLDANSLWKQLETTIPTLEGWCPVDKAKEMAKWILLNKPTLCVEIGVFAGRSLLAIGMALKHNNNKHNISAMVHGIDPWSKDAALQGQNEDEHYTWWSNVDYDHFYQYTQHKIKDYQLESFVKLVRDKSERVVEDYSNEQVDLVHIDGNHSEEVSTSDVLWWGPKVKRGGIIILDDTDWKTTQTAIKTIQTIGFVLEKDFKSWQIYRKI